MPGPLECVVVPVAEQRQVPVLDVVALEQPAVGAAQAVAAARAATRTIILKQQPRILAALVSRPYSFRQIRRSRKARSCRLSNPQNPWRSTWRTITPAEAIASSISITVRTFPKTFGLISATRAAIGKATRLWSKQRTFRNPM